MKRSMQLYGTIVKRTLLLIDVKGVATKELARALRQHLLQSHRLARASSIPMAAIAPPGRPNEALRSIANSAGAPKQSGGSLSPFGSARLKLSRSSGVRPT
jgi:hypothetical protein